jgi:polysaccharide biosynthesis protein PslH
MNGLLETMHILYIVPYVPNLIYVRPYQMIRGLLEQGHQVSVATVWTNEADQKAITDLEAFGADVFSRLQPITRSLMNAVAALPQSIPLQAVYSWQPQLAAAVERLLLQTNGKLPFDVIHVEHLRGAQYGLYVKQLRSRHGYTYLKQVPIIWDSVDSISHLFRQASRRSKKLTSRLITRLELPRTEKYERMLASSFDHVLVTSHVDQAAHQTNMENGVQPQISVLPNGVDLDYFHAASPDTREPGTLVVSGKMSYHANVTMVLFLATQVMPLIWREVPAARLLIVGKNPSRQISKLAEHPQIEVTGTVPDVRPYLQKASVAVAPIQYGAGIQNKVLEAMACGTPVVCTPQAVTALQVQPGKELLTGETPEDFASAVIQLLKDGELRAQIGQAGRAYVEKHHDWHKITRDLAEIYRQTALRLRDRQ